MVVLRILPPSNITVIVVVPSFSVFNTPFEAIVATAGSELVQPLYFIMVGVYSNRQVAELSGVPLDTIQKVFSGKIARPRYDTLKALEKAFASEDQHAGFPYPDLPSGRGIMKISDSAPVYGSKKRGEYTLDDYYKVHDDQRVELIEGDIFVMEAPTSIHQLITGRLYAEFLSLITGHAMDCIPFISPSGSPGAGVPWISR